MEFLNRTVKEVEGTETVRLQRNSKQSSMSVLLHEIEQEDVTANCRAWASCCGTVKISWCEELST